MTKILCSINCVLIDNNLYLIYNLFLSSCFFFSCVSLFAFCSDLLACGSSQPPCWTASGLWWTLVGSAWWTAVGHWTWCCFARSVAIGGWIQWSSSTHLLNGCYQSYNGIIASWVSWFYFFRFSPVTDPRYI